MAVHKIKISNKNTQEASFAVFADSPDIAQAYARPKLVRRQLALQADPEINVCAWMVQTLPPNAIGEFSLNMNNYAWACKDLGDGSDADLVTILPPRSCVSFDLLIEDTIKNPNGAAVTLRARNECPVLGIEPMPNIIVKPGSFPLYSDSSFGSAEKILVGIGKLGIDSVVPVAVWPARPNSTILVRPNDQVLWVSQFIGVQGQVGMPQEAIKIDFSINENKGKTASVTYDDHGNWSEPVFNLE